MDLSESLRVLETVRPVPLGAAIVAYLAALGTTLPSGAGYAGPYQYAFVLSLGAFAISRETALAVSLAAQLAFFGTVAVIGLAFLWRKQLRSGWQPSWGGPGLEGGPKLREREIG